MLELWWVELSLFPLMGRVTSGGEFWGVCEFHMILGILSADGWGCVPVLLVVWHEVYSTGACKQLGGARSCCQDGYLQESTHKLIFLGSGNSLAVQCPGLGTLTNGSNLSVHQQRNG